MSDFSVNDPSSYCEPRYVVGRGELSDLDDGWWDSVLSDYSESDDHIVRGSE